MILAELAAVPQVPEELTYQARLRSAAAGCLSEQDIVDVVDGIKTRAKAGDKVAIDHLLQIMGGMNRQPTKIVNNLVVQDVETAARLKRNGSKALS